MDSLLAIGLLVISIVLLVANFSDIRQTHKNG
jgi:hypothetical protein